MAIIQSLPLGGSGSTYTNMTTDEAIAGTNAEERVVSAKVLNDAIDNKIPTVNNATLTIQKNGTTVKTFTANASANVTANITVPTKVSDLTNDSGFLTTHQDISGKADKATTLSGYGITDAYTKTQVDNKIPTVNNATLTIQKNGTTVKTFTANASSNVTCNITVPTKISDLTNDSGFVVDVSGKADKATTLSGYGITDAYTKTQVDTKISNLVNSAPETLDTLNELASALGNDPNFATTVANQIGTKANDSDVVHKSGNETIKGNKYFDGNFVDVNGYRFRVKGTNQEVGVIPTDGNKWNGFSFHDKNNKQTFAIENGHLANGNTMLNFSLTRNLADSTLYNYESVRFFKDGENCEKSLNCDVYPNVNNKYVLGTSSLKWKDVQTYLLNGKTPAYADDLTNYVTRTEVNTLQTNRLKPSSVVFTVAPSDWKNGVCTKNVGVDSKYYCTLGVPTSTNTTNLVNVSSASIIITGHSENNLTLKCLGNVPTSTITLELTVFYYDVIDKNTDYFNITEQEINDIFGL